MDNNKNTAAYINNRYAGQNGGGQNTGSGMNGNQSAMQQFSNNANIAGQPYVANAQISNNMQMVNSNMGMGGSAQGGTVRLYIPKIILSVFLIITGILVATSVFMPLLSGMVQGEKESCNIIDQIKGIVKLCSKTNFNYINVAGVLALIVVFLSFLAGVVIFVSGLTSTIMAIVSAARPQINDIGFLLSRFKALVILEFIYLLALDYYRVVAFALNVVSDDEYTLSLSVGWWLPAAFSVAGLILAIILRMVENWKTGLSGKLINIIMGSTNLLLGMVLSFMVFMPVIDYGYRNESMGIGLNHIFVAAFVGKPVWIILMSISAAMLLVMFIFHVHLIRQGINGILENKNYSTSIIVVGSIDIVFSIVVYILFMVAVGDDSEYYTMGSANIIYIVLGALLLIEGILHKILGNVRAMGNSVYQGYNNNINGYQQQGNGYTQNYR